jgi:hypothetical protein
MTVFAHVAGVPVEEAALTLAPSAGLLLLAARAWLARVRAGARAR